jgi:serine/threonine protein kinase
MSGDLPAGSTFGGYRIERLVARGGMGAVYLASEPATCRRVALKLVLSDLADDDEFRARFEREARLTAQLAHPNIVQLYAAGEIDGALYAASRFIDGGDLEAVIAHHGVLHVLQGVAITAQVGSALDAAHACGLVHRDVKPANVLIEEHGSVATAYLADFGLSKHVGSLSGLTRTGMWVGTIDYAAPEQIQGETIGPATDVYALGCVVYEMLAGEVPYPRARDVDKIIAHISEEPPKLPPTVPHDVNAVITRALAKRPEERFDSAGQLVDSLQKAAQMAGEAPTAALLPPLGAPGGAGIDRGAPTAG